MDVYMREATIEDLPQIVAMLADDALGSTREVIDENITGETDETVAGRESAGTAVSDKIITVSAGAVVPGETITVSAVPDCYLRAFRNITSDPNSHIFTACDGTNPTRVLGAFQITFTQYLSHQGAIRATIENVRVHRDVRNQGVGSRMIRFAIGYAKEQGASMVQLTTDKRRKDAHRFYERLGFAASHEGMKLKV